MTAKVFWLVTVCFTGAALVGLSAERAAPQSSLTPRQQLQQYVAQLQNDPNNTDLREKIIKLALTIKPAPAIPDKDKVLELEGEAKGALKTASTQADYLDALKLLQKALFLAPWDADLNYNLAKAQELAKQYDDASASYKLYLLAAPNAKDHDSVVEKIGELKYEAKHAAESPPTTKTQPAEPPQIPQPEILGPNIIAGTWSYCRDDSCNQIYRDALITFYVRDETITMVIGPNLFSADFPHACSQMQFRYVGQRTFVGDCDYYVVREPMNQQYSFTVSEDSKTMRVQFSGNVRGRGTLTRSNTE
jgi:tetratricopeptide (TPR) repeat protein